ncbi:hypothetical protein [Proteiniborus sp.]|uniref:hypothetical protein n=1 Tax=Proteiniborus sp. TaxID=2079015 RepID=UPI00331830F2
MKRIFDKIESIILVLSIIGVLFFVIQLGFIADIEMPVFYDHYEIEIDNNYTKNEEVGYIIIKKNSTDFSKLKVNINGRGKYKFDDNSELTIKVYDGDMIEVDGTMYDDEIEIKVVGISKNIKEPRLNQKLVIKEGIKSFPKVKIYKR